MTKIQQIIWELETDYIGHPYYVSGNAILNALHSRVVYDEWKDLHSSHGVFVPGQFGRYPDAHTKNGTHPALGSSLVDVEAYDDLFLHRQPEHPWLLTGRPRDAINTHGLRIHGTNIGFAPRTQFGGTTGSVKWYIHAYLHSASGAISPLSERQLDGLQFGGKRNYGYGEVRLKDTRCLDTDDLDYSELRNADRYLIELLTPYVLGSEYPGAENVDVPWWWDETISDLRTRQDGIVEDCEGYELRTVDHGQVVLYTGDEPIETALNGIERVGTHRKYGFGEIRVKPISEESTEP